MVARKHSRSSRSRASDDAREPGSGTHDIWKGSVSFGLVEIPVALVSAERSTRVPLTYLDRRDFSPVGYRRYNKKTEAEVPWSEIVHGYEYSKGKYVALSKAELKRANPTLTQTIAIEKFVDASEIDPALFEKTYYVEPARKYSRSYALLRDTLERTQKLGVARVVVRTRERVAALGVRGPALVRYLLRFADEVRKPDALDNLVTGRDAPKSSPQELKMAERLVEDMSGKSDPGEYRDDYARDLRALIEKKLESGDTHTVEEEEEPEPQPKRGEIIDLMPLLQRSLKSSRAPALSERRASLPRAKRPQRAKPARARPARRTRRSA
jgi:DNA end-binding protein Ku